MGKMNELSQVITELRDCGKALVNMADSLQEIFSAPVNEPAAENPVQKEPEKREASAPAKPTLTFTDVRKLLSQKSRAGHTAEVKALLSPSSAHRRLNCPPSAKLCAAQEETTSVYARQGTDAHELCQYNLEMARYDFEMPVNLNNIEIAAILDKADQLSAWVEDVKEYALAEALKGTHFDGYKVVAGRANRKYADESAAAAAVIAAGADPYEKKLLGITAMTALLGKKKFEEILGSLVIKPQGKPVLVKANDKRPEYNSAINDFNE